MQQVPAGCGWVGRAIGLDFHRDFCEIAICEGGVVRSAGRVKTTPEALEVLAAGLEPSDRVALEVSGGSWEVARILEGHVQQVIVVSPDDTGIAQAPPRRTGSTGERWPSCSGRATLTRCGCPMSAVACCGVGWRAVSSWSARARA